MVGEDMGSAYSLKHSRRRGAHTHISFPSHAFLPLRVWDIAGEALETMSLLPETPEY